MNSETPRIRVAVIGCGYWGKNLVRNFAELGALAAISDTGPRYCGQSVGTLRRPGTQSGPCAR